MQSVRWMIPVFVAILAAVWLCGTRNSTTPQIDVPIQTLLSRKMPATNEEWKKVLTPAQYRVMRNKGTEMAFTGVYWNYHEKGEYVCAGCGSLLFSSEQKFDSGTGWPSFWKPAAQSQVAEEDDSSFGMTRTEVHCKRCGAHLGHVFDDGPKPTGLRYCINSVSLQFEPSVDENAAKKK